MASRDDGGWEFELRPYLWGASLSGDVGIEGIVAPVDLSTEDILDNLDMGAAATFLCRRNRWYFFADFNYLKISSDIEPVPLDILDMVGVDIEQYLWQLTVAYRALEWGERKDGFLALAVGARGIDLSQKINIAVDEEGVAATSRAISQTVVDQAAREARRSVDAVLPTIQEGMSDAVLQPIIDEIVYQIGNLDPPDLNPGGPAGDLIEDRLAEKQDEIIRARDEVIQAIVEQRIAEEIEGVQSEASAKARRARAEAERRLAGALEESITDAIPGKIEADDSWVDPIVGVVARHYFTSRFYLNLYADIGGFGAASDLTASVVAGPGWVVNDWLSLESFYRYLHVDYEDDGFVFDVEMHGALLGAVFKW